MNKMIKFDLLISRNNIYELPKRKGIYVFLSDKRIPLYVGQSINVRSRVTGHFTGNSHNFTPDNIQRIYEVGIIFCSDNDNLDDVEKKYISLLKPILNVDKVDYAKEIDIETLKIHGLPSFVLCKYSDIFDPVCNKISTLNGYCCYHDPDRIPNAPSWMMRGKFVTTEMQRLIFESEYKKYPMYFYMDKQAFGKLLLEKTFAEIDCINNELVLKFKKHFIIIDDEETIRLEIR